MAARARHEGVRRQSFTLTLLVAACTSSQPQSAAKDRAARCKAVTDIAGQQAALLVGALSLAGGGGDPMRESAAEARMAMRFELDALRESCLAWPERTVKCFDSPMWAALHRDECERRSAEALGQPVPVGDVGAGPTPAWSYTFPASPDPLLVRADGWMLARSIETDEEYNSTHRITAVRDGKLLWQQERYVSSQIRDLAERGIAVMAEGKLELLDPGTGQVRETIELTGAERPDFDPEYDSAPAIKTFTPIEGGLLLGDDDAYFYRTTAEGIVLDGVLAEETLDTDARLWMDGEARWLWEGSDVRLFDAQWKTLVHVRAHDMLGSVLPVGGGVVMVIDDEVVKLEADECRAPGQVSVTDWPHQGDWVIDDECPHCTRAPAGCVAWAKHVRDVSMEPVAVSESGGVIVTDGEQTLALDETGTRWSVGNGAGGRSAVATDVFVVSPEESRTRLWRLDASTGAARWATELPATSGDIYSTAEVHVYAAGPWVYAGYGETVSAVNVGD